MRLDPLRQSYVARMESGGNSMGILYIYRHENLAHPAGRGDCRRPGPAHRTRSDDRSRRWPRQARLGGEDADDGLVLLYAGAALYESNSTSIEMLRSTIFWLLYACSIFWLLYACSLRLPAA